MKILQVIPYFCFGGAEIMCENLTYALQKQGHEVVVVSLYAERTPISERMEQSGVKILYLDKKLGLDLTMVPKLAKIMKQERPEVVHTHLDVIKYAVAAAKLSGIRRCVHTVHSVAHKEAEGRIQKLVNSIYYKFGWSVPIALSAEVQDTIIDFYGLKKENVPVIYNGVDLTKCMVKESYALHAPVKILHIGRFDTPKNHGGLLRAFKNLLEVYPDCQLELVGDGDLRPQIERQIDELNLQNQVVLHGMQSNVYPYLQEADLFVLPSTYEGNPMTIIEAMGTGLPIVATMVGGIPDMVRDGETALLVPCEEEAIQKACERLIADQTMRETLAAKAKLDSVRFSAAFMAAQYCNVYRK